MTDPSKAVADPPGEVDSEVLRLRSTGRAFAAISRDLGLARSADAQRAFQRAVRALPAGEQAKVRQAESSLLDRLAAQVNADTSRPDDDRARRLAVIDRLRGLLADS